MATPTKGQWRFRYGGQIPNSGAVFVVLELWLWRAAINDYVPACDFAMCSYSYLTTMGVLRTARASTLLTAACREAFRAWLTSARRRYSGEASRRDSGRPVSEDMAAVHRALIQTGHIPPRLVPGSRARAMAEFLPNEQMSIYSLTVLSDLAALIEAARTMEDLAAAFRWWNPGKNMKVVIEQPLIEFLREDHGGIIQIEVD